MDGPSDSNTQTRTSLSDALDAFLKDGLTFERNKSANTTTAPTVTAPQDDDLEELFSELDAGFDLDDLNLFPAPSDVGANYSGGLPSFHPGHPINAVDMVSLENAARSVLESIDAPHVAVPTPFDQPLNTLFPPHPWGVLNSVPYQPGQVLTLPNGQKVQLVLQPNHGGVLTADSPVKRNQQKRRKTVKPASETAIQRSQRLAQGYSFDPSTGKMFRHGPAMEDAAKQDREVPPVRQVFEAYASKPFSTEAPNKPAESTAAVMLKVDARGPSVRELEAPTNSHGMITSLVTRELQSAPLPAPMAELERQGSRQLLGVSRDKWNLFWDAWVMAPKAQESITEGFKQEAVHLGKFATQAQAARARDIATLKMHGDVAIVDNLNFPLETYTNTLPVLQAHSGDDIVAALRKDSQLAMQRTSKYKGIRRVGPGCFEARLEDVPEAVG